MKIIITVSIIFVIIDCILTGLALEMFYLRTIAQNDLNVGDKVQVEEFYEKVYNNKTLSGFIYTFWGNEKMLKSFPNLRIIDNDDKIIYMDSLYPEIQTYYLKVK